MAEKKDEKPEPKPEGDPQEEPAAEAQEPAADVPQEPRAPMFASAAEAADAISTQMGAIALQALDEDALHVVVVGVASADGEFQQVYEFTCPRPEGKETTEQKEKRRAKSLSARFHVYGKFKAWLGKNIEEITTRLSQGF